MFNENHEDSEDRMATPAQADQEWVRNVGMDRPDEEWILSDRDVWYRNPFYTGVIHPGHPEDDRDPLFDGFRSDAEADADVLRSAGWGTDEDYGGGDNEYV